jgi:AbiU2
VLNDARRSEAKARKHRNKRIAHNDLQTHLDDAVLPLPNATVGEMNELLELTQMFVNRIDMYYGNNHYSRQVLNGDADTMIGFLADGMRYRQDLQNQRQLSLGQQKVDWEIPSDV